MLLYDNYDVEAYLEASREELGDREYSEEELYSLAYKLMHLEYEEFIEPYLIQYFNTHKCVVVGSIRRWDGEIKGGELMDGINDYYKLIDACDYIHLELNENELSLKCSHHDGTNYFSIRELTQDGIEYFEDNIWEMDYNKLFNELYKNLSITPTLKCFD